MPAEHKKSNIIRLTQGFFAEVDAEDAIWLSRNRWYAKRTTAIKEEFGTYYAARKIKGQTIYMHREIMNCPFNREIDHKDGKSLNNKRENLRVCTRQQNNTYREARR